MNRFPRLVPLFVEDGWEAFSALTERGDLVELRTPLASRDDARVQETFGKLKLLRLIRHPGLRAVDVVDDEATPAFATIEPVRADHVVSAHGIAAGEFRSVATTLLAALAEVHRCGMILGNVSPLHLARRSDGSWMLDAAFPRTCSDESSIDSARFAAPEVTLGQPPDAAADVYSLSATLMWLAGLDQHRDAAGDVCAVAGVLDGGCHPDPVQRCSAQDLADKLESLTDHEPSARRRSSGAAGTRNAGELARTIVGEKAESAGDSPNLPKTLGRFELGERLGAGAVGTVYRGLDQATGATVAIKVLNEKLAANPVTLRRFSKEARMLARAGNVYVANLVDANCDQGIHFLAIEFVAGGTLGSVLTGGRRLPESVALRVLADIASGLAVAHRQSIVHRDLKPDNILLTEQGAAYIASALSDRGAGAALEEGIPLLKVSDFGLAREDQQSDSLAITQDGAILGTPLYMSPEQCRGQQSDVRSDVYALGVIAFQLLSGHPPFKGENHIAVLTAHCQEPVPALRQLRPELSDGVVAVIEKCLAKNPDARYSDATALLADLRQLLHGEAGSLQLHPAAPRTDRQILEFRFVCDLNSAPAQLWPFVSHTDRVNHALGLPAVTYTTRMHPERGVERFAEARLAGQRLVWQEHPYEWTEGRRLSVLREFSTGPFQWFMSIIDLQPLGSGTRLTQTLRVVPRNWLGRLLAKIELGHRTPRNFSRTYRQIDAYLIENGERNPGRDAFGTSALMTTQGRMRLHERLDKLRESRLDPAVIETLGQFLEHASDLEVARIRPLVFAERFGLAPQQVINACLTGAREGLLVLLWDILCPSCRIPADVQETLASLSEHAYCPSCDVKYEVDFANSVEMIFRVHPEVRVAETRTYCVGGPAFSAHVVAQVRLAPGERFELELALSEGTYRLRGNQLPFAVDLRVSSGGGERRLELILNRPPAPGTVPVLRSGSQMLTLVNPAQAERQVRLERSAGRSMAVTAAAAASMPLFRDMFPDEVLAPGQIVSVTSVTLLMLDISATRNLYRSLGDGRAFGKIRQRLLQIEDVIRSAGGAVVKFVGDGMVSTFASTDGAVAAAVTLLSTSTRGDEDLPLKLSLHRGPALVTTINGRLDYFGETVHIASQLLAMTSERELLLSAGSGSLEALQSATAGTTLRVTTSPLMLSDVTAILLSVRSTGARHERDVMTVGR